MSSPANNAAGGQLIALIVDDLSLSEWQARALSAIAEDSEFIILNCTNTRRSTHPLKHGLYYALRLQSLSMPLTRSCPIPAHFKIRRNIAFKANTDGSWQSFPQDVLQQIEDSRPAAIIKFGMGLLRVPPDLPCPILSYHHGDPRQFRGRPAGFYEMLSGERCVGQVVQILSNKLDSGKVVAFAESRIQPHSYRATMEEAYRCSTLLLPKALDNALSKTILPLEPSGRNCRLPSNSTVVRFLGKMAAASIRRFAYGTFFEKRWQIATAPCGALDAELLVSDFPDPTTWQNFDCPKNYRFVADPFPNPVAEGVLAEGLRRSDRQGEILHLSSRQPTILCSGKGHFSYPATICIGPDCFLIPEISEWSSPRIFRLSPDSVKEVGRLRVEGSPQLIDPTLHRDSAGTIYLFANCNETGPGVLRLWVACNVFDTFSEHPLSPVCISPAGARMGGALIEGNGRLYRFGQDGARDYGDGLLLFSITELSERCYREEEVGRLQLSSVKGPHTLNFQGEKALFDFYRDRFTPLAGLGRLQSRLAKHRAKRT